MTVFQDRDAAGRALGAALENLRAEHPLVLGLPRGGVPVARAVAHTLDTDMDILLVRKLGVPWHPELAMGAIGEGGIRVFNNDVLAQSRVPASERRRVERRERAELQRRTRMWRGTGTGISPADRVVIIVDDGMATGATAVAACSVVRAARPRHIVVGMPVSGPTATRRLEHVADEVVCLSEPIGMSGVGAAYRDFHQLADREVIDLLGPV